MVTSHSHTTSPLFFCFAGNMANGDNFGYDYENGYSSIITENLTSDFCVGNMRIAIINMNGRMYDPVIGRMLSPDRFVANATNSQDFNRYSYARNNPLLYTDPTGEFVWIPIIIGAVIGATSGAMIGNANGATGWHMVGYIAGGALIGGLSGGAAAGIGAAGGAAWWAGAAAGAISGAGFSGLATNWNGDAMWNGAWKGALSGFVGGGLGSAIGGGWGAFAGGAVGSGLNTALNGGNGGQIALSAALGGALAYGTYELSSYIAYKQAHLTINDYEVSYKQYKTMQADFQRSRFWRKEYGGLLTDDGGVVRAPAKNRHNFGVDFTHEMNDAALAKGDVAAMYHTHWAKDGVTYYVNGAGDIMRDGTGFQYTTSNGPSPVDMAGAKYFAPNHFLIDRNYLYNYNTSSFGYNDAFLFRYFPLYWLWLNK